MILWSHICWSSLHSPPPAKHVSCFPQLFLILGHSVQLPTVWKSVFSKIGRLLAESYLCNKRSDRQNKICLRNAIPSPFSLFLIFYVFLNLSQDFRAKLRYKSCVQLPILWKTHFSQTLMFHIFATKRRTDKIKYVLETPFLFRFFHILLLFEFNPLPNGPRSNRT